MRRSTTARSIVGGTENPPGSFNASIDGEVITLTSETFDSAFTGLSLVDFPGLPAVEPGEQMIVTANVTNGGSTNTFDSNSCSEGLPEGADGTELRLVVEAGGSGGSNTVCIQDNPLIGGPFTEPVSVVFNAIGQENTTFFPTVWLELADGTRVTPKYRFTMETVDTSEGESSDFAGDIEDPTGDDSTAEENFDPTDEQEFTFDLDAYEWSCNVRNRTINQGESVEFGVDLSGFLPPGEDSVDVPIKFLLDGEIVGTDTGFITANGSNGGSTTLVDLAPGDYDLAYRVGDQPREECGTLTVEPVFGPGNVSVSCSREVSEITTGESFDLTITATNDNPMAAQVEYDVRIGGSVAGGDTLTVQPRSQATTTVPVTVESAGEFDIAVDYSAIEL